MYLAGVRQVAVWQPAEHVSSGYGRHCRRFGPSRSSWKKSPDSTSHHPFKAQPADCAGSDFGIPALHVDAATQTQHASCPRTGVTNATDAWRTKSNSARRPDESSVQKHAEHRQTHSGGIITVRGNPRSACTRLSRRRASARSSALVRTRADRKAERSSSLIVLTGDSGTWIGAGD